MNAPDVRLLAPADSAAYVVLRREMLTESPWAFASSPEDDWTNDPAKLAAAFDGSGERTIAGAFVSGRLVASAGVLREDHLKMRHRAWIVGVYVRPDARSRGLGRAVVALAIETARGWGCDAVSLSVSARSPAALALYRSMGFVQWGVEPRVVRLENEDIDEVHMQLAL